MSVTYIDEFDIPGLSSIGIEDHESPGEHFMPDRAHKRFAVWVGGCGVGQYDTLDAARQRVLEYARSSLLEKSGTAQRALDMANENLRKLGVNGDLFNLAQFKVPT